MQSGTVVDHRQSPGSLSRLPPHNIEAERALLGALMLNNAAHAKVATFLLPEHFMEAVHRQIYETVDQLIRGGKLATPIILKGYLGDDELAEGITPMRYLSRLAAEATTVLNAGEYGRTIYELAMRRRLIAAAEEVARVAYESPVDASASSQIDRAEVTFATLRAGMADTAGGPVPTSTFTGRLLAGIRAARDGNAPPVPSSGYRDIDRQLGGGLRSGRLIVLAGRPGMGKTILGAGIARRVAKSGIGSAYFSLEIDGEELTARCVADSLARTHFPLAYRDVLAGHDLTPDDEDRVRATVEQIDALPLQLDDSGGLTIAQIEARTKLAAERLRKRGHPLGVVVVDYLGLVQPADRYKGAKVDEVGEIAAAAKNMAKRLGICVVLLAQLNRSVEMRDDKRPLKSDLRDSGNIEEHADAVGLLYRPHYYTIQSTAYTSGDPDTIDKAARQANQLFVNWDKNRLGPTGSVELWCDVGRSAVRDASRY